MKFNWIAIALSLTLGAFGANSIAVAQSENRESTPQPGEASQVENNAAIAATLEQLQNTRWLLEDLSGTGVMDNLQTTLEFGEGNRIYGNGGCNRYFGQIATENNQLAVGPIGATRKLCPPAIMNQEDRFTEALRSANRIVIDGPFLLIYSNGAEQPLKFTQITVNNR